MPAAASLIPEMEMRRARCIVVKLGENQVQIDICFPSITVPKQSILFIRKIHSKLVNPPRLNTTPIPPPILPITQPPIQKSRRDQYTPGCDAQNHSIQVPWCRLWFPQLRTDNTPKAKTNEVYCVDDGSLGVAFYVRGVEA